MSADDLSGEWRGIFNYPAGAPPTEFVAVLTDADGGLIGHSVEPGLRGGEVTARLDGRRTGDAVSFVKLYEQDDDLYDDVTYAGTIGAEGHEITGRWSIPGNWSGTFIMVRERDAPAEPEAVTADAASAERMASDQRSF
jgi:hypothetical protein